MFQAMIYACLAANMEMCVIAEDTLGPYKTVEECMDRIGELSITVMNDGLVPTKYRCLRVKGEPTSYEPTGDHTRQDIKTSS